MLHSRAEGHTLRSRARLRRVAAKPGACWTLRRQVPWHQSPEGTPGNKQSCHVNDEWAQHEEQEDSSGLVSDISGIQRATTRAPFEPAAARSYGRFRRGHSIHSAPDPFPPWSEILLLQGPQIPEAHCQRALRGYVVVVVPGVDELSEHLELSRFIGGA